MKIFAPKSLSVSLTRVTVVTVLLLLLLWSGSCPGWYWSPCRPHHHCLTLPTTRYWSQSDFSPTTTGNTCTDQNMKIVKMENILTKESAPVCCQVCPIYQL